MRRALILGLRSCAVTLVIVAAVGCASDGTNTGPVESGEKDAGVSASVSVPVKPGNDPMQIAQQAPPSSPRPAATAPDAPNAGLFPEQGSTSFETAKAESGASEVSSGGDERADSDFGGKNSAGPSVPATPTGTAPPGAAPGVGQEAAPGAAPQPGIPGGSVATPNVAREIIEADIVQTKGDILYALNRYRGLLLVDMSQPDAPRIAGRVPFQAQPVDMYLRGDNAYVVMSDYFSYWQFDSDADPLGFHGSQVLVVDVKDPAQPKVAGSFNVEGEVTDTRIVGDVLYAVSKRNPEYWRYDTQDWKDTTWVMSIDIADPKNIRSVEKHEFPGSANLIQVYQTALSIAALDPNYYLVDSDNARQTLITFVDISDPKGVIKVGGTAYVPGMVQDKFKMDLNAGQLRILSQDWYWRPDGAATLTLFDASDPAKLVQSAQIAVANDTGNANYANVQATRFAGNNLYVNLCWWEPNGQQQLCRNDFYDLSQPSSAARVSSLFVDGPVTHFEPREGRVLSLGMHTIWNAQSPVQIALYDVSVLRSARRLSAVDLGDLGAGSVALEDYKAFKVFDELGMILLPLSWTEQIGGNYYGKQGAQIVDFTPDALTARGRVAQNGYVERAIAFRERVLSISTEQIQVIDARDRDRPVVTSTLFLVRDVVDTFRIRGYQVQLGVAEDDTSYRFFVLPFGEDDMAKSVAELVVPSSLHYQMQDGDIVHVIGRDPATGAQVIRNADFSDPLNPRWRGEYRIADDIQHIYSGAYRGYWSFYDFYWNPNAGKPLNNQLLPVTTREVKTGGSGRRYYQNQLRMIDLRDPDQPRLATGSLDMPEWPFVNRVGHGTMLFSTHTEPALDKNGNPKLYHERHFLDRVDASNPDQLKNLPKVNIPGRLVDVDASGTLLYTVDYQWDEFGRRRNSFNVLKLVGDTATLVSVLPVGDEIDRARYIDREVWLSTHRYSWWGRSDDSPDSRQPYTRLSRLRFDETAALIAQDSHDIAGYNFNLLDVEGTRVYLSSSYPTGLLVLDSSNFQDPTVLGASRTIGYVSKLVRDAGFLYLPMGAYGVRRVQAP